MRYILDTHTLVWRLVAPKKLSPAAQSIFLNEENEFRIPTICILEIQYLAEIGRIAMDPDSALTTIQDEPNFYLAPFEETVMLHSLKLTTTRDPFDRMILAHALASSTKIITKDRWMKQTAPHLVVI